MDSNFFQKVFRYVYLHAWQYRRIGVTHRHRLDAISHRGGQVRVAFIAMNLSMWRYQHLYELMLRDQRFAPVIILSPSIDYTKTQQRSDVESMRR